MEKTRRSRSRSIALAAMLAALYAADVVFFAPISFQTIQVRVADALLPLSVLFGLRGHRLDSWGTRGKPLRKPIRRDRCSGRHHRELRGHTPGFADRGEEV